MNSEVKKQNAYLENLNWRYATKQFDPSKKVSKENLELLMESVRLSASSYGLQPYEIVVVEDLETRKKLKDAAYGQPQLIDSNYVFVFSNFRKIEEKHVEDYMQNISDTRNVSREDLKGMEDTIKNTINSLSQEQQQIWGAKQAYLALGNFLSAAANSRIDACPMEGFENEKFDEILHLKDKNLKSAVIACIGYRSEEDSLQYQEKVRKSKSEIFHII
ncbi:NAD(P)H-dependent oxidoreductase [Gramella sp. AN32]|uniref:NAD(P)H-dependent oxidoreductase n=1 Tax=Christiangramia antarctica TaxID=2058158 RepID=A0ABW5XBC3_9FLAO|nr:NAD(P)H-dependent oxidoreductase [Gramella sp. AN32]MCM4155941.1 NAD(P)H-dependent oxidoreductase [Gramella sp. AN32]